MKRLAWLVILCAVGAMRAQTTAGITGIAFMRVYSTDAAASDAFYGGTLGFAKVVGADGVARYGVNEGQWVEVVPLAAGAGNSRLAEIAFTVRDLEGLSKYLDAHGYRKQVREGKDGFAVIDPEGNVIGFVRAGAMKGKLVMSPRASSHRIIHVGFVVRDRAAEDTFFKMLLGFKPYWHGGKTDDRTDYVSQQVPNGTDWLEYMLNNPDPDAHTLGVMNHFSLGVAHMSDALKALAANGCASDQCRKTQMGRDGKVQANLFDPDQTRVEFMEFDPSGTTCCSAFTGKQPTEKEDQ